MNGESGAASQGMTEGYLEYLLAKAELNIYEFDIHRRTELKNMNRTLPYYVMSYHKCGNAMLRVGNEVHSIGPGTVILIPPHVEHDHFKATADETVFLWWHFTFTLADVIDVLKIFQLPITFQLHDSREFESAFDQFMESTRGKGYLPKTILKKAKALELLYIVLESALQSNLAVGKTVDQLNGFLGVLVQMVRHPEREISLKSLAQELHMHPTYISNRFRRLFGKSPMQVHREMKIQLAKTLLETSDMPITEIAQRCGFVGIQEFDRVFKRIVGITPSQFRRTYGKWRSLV
ncbi:MAG: AraC family transcriptional regulator [Alicyclobacillus sp.]|nr:AraC family transcriptional regulator [Alicyclobacillus sp.]